jgi:hypothetical protein
LAVSPGEASNAGIGPADVSMVMWESMVIEILLWL